MRLKLIELQTIVKQEALKAHKDAENTYVSAVEITASARHSPSQSGDREHATNQAAITAERYERLLLLTKELEEAVKSTRSLNKIITPCFVRLKHHDDFLDLYVVKYPVYLQKMKIVSCKSPLGAKLINTRKGSRLTVFDQEWIVYEIG